MNVEFFANDLVDHLLYLGMDIEFFMSGLVDESSIVKVRH
jgi:hypothetical protein